MRYVSSIVAIATLAVTGCEAIGPVPHATPRVAPPIMLAMTAA